MSDSEELSDENSYKYSDTESDILEELVDEFKTLKPYKFELEKEKMTNTGESGKDSEKSDDGSQNLAINERIEILFGANVLNVKPRTGK